MSQGQPNWFQCSQCRKNKPWHPAIDPKANRRGLLQNVTLTGRAKSVDDGHARGRSANTRFEYKCNDCGHVGWTRHCTVLMRARNEGIPTPGSEKRR